MANLAMPVWLGTSTLLELERTSEESSPTNDSFITDQTCLKYWIPNLELSQVMFIALFFYW